MMVASPPCTRRIQQSACWRKSPDHSDAAMNRNLKGESLMSGVSRYWEVATWLRRVSLLIFVAMGFALAATVPATAATVTTDRSDYAPFEIVTITGSGWQPFEEIEILLHE